MPRPASRACEGRRGRMLRSRSRAREGHWPGSPRAGRAVAFPHAPRSLRAARMLWRQLCASRGCRLPASLPQPATCSLAPTGAARVATLRVCTTHQAWTVGRSLATAAHPALALGRLNHLAIAVPDLQASVALYRDVLGAQVSEPESLPEHGVTVVFVELPNTKIELLHPYGDKSPIQGFLDKNPSGGAFLGAAVAPRRSSIAARKNQTATC